MKNKKDISSEHCPKLDNTMEKLRLLYLHENVFMTSAKSWLEAIVEQNKDSLVRQYRNIYSEIFLQSVLYPAVESQLDISEQVLAELLINFKMSILGLGSDFEISNVVGSVLNHFQCYSVNDVDPILVQSPILEKDLMVFVILNDLDLKVVDQIVLNQFNSN